MKLLKWFGSATGITAALLLAANVTLSPWAFPIYVLSNSVWIYVAYKNSDSASLWMFVIWTAISAFGIYQWLIV